MGEQNKHEDASRYFKKAVACVSGSRDESSRRGLMSTLQAYEKFLVSARDNGITVQDLEKTLKTVQSRSRKLELELQM